jgi:hypothetical protein
MLHTGTYWLIWSLRRMMLTHSSWRMAHFDTLRLRLFKIVARVVEWKTKVWSTCPDPVPTRPSCGLCWTACRGWPSEPLGGVAPIQPFHRIPPQSATSNRHLHRSDDPRGQNHQASAAAAKFINWGG